MTINRPTKGRALRADYGIVGYVGPNGGGKSAAAIWDTLPTLAAGRPVLSTVRLLDYTNPRPCEGCDLPGHEFGHMQAHPLWIPFTDWLQLLDWKFGDVIMDEVTGVASSRESHSMPGEVANHLTQLRRGDTVVRWTAPSWKRADTIIRECSQLAIACKGFMPKRFQAAPGEPERRWKQRRLFVWRAFDATQFEDFSVNARDRLKPLGTDWHWGPGSTVFDAYDTYDSVLAIGQVNPHGNCMTCGGRRSRPACRCVEAPKRRTTQGPEAGGAPEGGTGSGHAPADVSGSDHDCMPADSSESRVSPTPTPVPSA